MLKWTYIGWGFNAMNTKKASSYTARPVDASGNVCYSEEDNLVWQTLMARQRPLVETHACQEYLDGLDFLDLPKDHVPQCSEISRILQKTTGWSVEPVPALISFDDFFVLLANRKFPVATFIRRKEDLDYLQEPDIFHEAFGHCPMLTQQSYADFTENYGKLALKASPEDRIMLARLYWFTIEFGLIHTSRGLRIYGGGILSSKGETIYALESKVPKRLKLDPIEALRTPYRIDIMQPIYFVIDDFDDLFKLTKMDLMKLVEKAKQLGMRDPLYNT